MALAMMEEHTIPGPSSRPKGSSRGIRVSSACDQCRVRKSKCDGTEPCSKCTQDDPLGLCSYTPRKRTRQINPSSGYVEVLETQQDRLLKAIREWYERTMAGEALCKRLDGGIPHPQRTIYGILESLGLLEEPVRSEFEAAECASCGQGLTHFFDRNDSSLPTASSPSNKGYSDALMAGDGEWLTHGADHAIDDTQSQFLSSWENRRSCQSMSRMDSVSYSNMNVASWPAPTLRAEDIDNWNSYAPWLGLQHGGYNTAEEGCWV